MDESGRSGGADLGVLRPGDSPATTPARSHNFNRGIRHNGGQAMDDAPHSLRPLLAELDRFDTWFFGDTPPATPHINTVVKRGLKSQACLGYTMAWQ